MARNTAEARRPHMEDEELPEGSGVEAPGALKMEKTNVGHEVGSVEHVKGLNGEDREELGFGTAGEGTETYNVSARKGADGETRLRAVSPAEVAAQDEVAKNFDALYYGFDAMAKATLATMPGLTPEASSQAMKAIAELNPLALVADAVKSQKNPSEALAGLLRAKLEAHPDVKSASERSLLQLESMRRQATELAHAAEKSGNEQAFQDAQADIYAAEKQILSLQERLNPNASTAERQRQADQLEGFVKVVPEPIYELGVGAVQDRMKELERLMSKADKGNNQLAWSTARNEYNRHRAIMPTLERVQKIQTLEADAQKAMDDAVAKQLLERGKARARTRAKKSYWNKVAEDTTYTLNLVTSALRTLEKTAASGTNVDAQYKKADTDRKELEAYLGQVKGQIESAQKENDRLKEAGIEIDLEPNAKVSSATTELYMNLATMNRENPDLVASYLGSALKSKDISPAGLNILKEFKTDLDAGKLNADQNLLDSRYSAEEKMEEDASLDLIDQVNRAKPVEDNHDEVGFGSPAMEKTRQVKMKREVVADEPPPIPETYVREMDTITPADTADQTNFVREMPVVTPKSKRGAMEGFGEWAAGGAHPAEQARQPEPQQMETVRESVRINPDRFPTQKLDVITPEPITEQAPRIVSEWWDQTGAEQFTGAWNSVNRELGSEAAMSALLSMGVPKGILKKYSTPEALYQFNEKPGFWATINGDAAATREGINRFIESVVATSKSSKMTGEQARSARGRSENQAKGPKGLV